MRFQEHALEPSASMQNPDDFLELSPELESEVALMTRELGAELRAANDVRGLTRTARLAMRQNSSTQRRTLKVLPAPQQPACKSGCGHCCHGIKVDVSPLEVITLVQHFQEHLSPEELEALRTRVEGEAERTKAMTVDDRLADLGPCVLLNRETQACTAYEVRPFACRSHHSLDVQACTAAATDGVLEIPTSAQLKMATALSILAFRRAVMNRGLDHAGYELVAALAVALREGAAMEWMNGGDVFSAARRARDEVDERRQHEDMLRLSRAPSQRPGSARSDR